MEEIAQALASLSRRVYTIAATEKAMQMGSPILGNMIMIGALLELNLVPLSAGEFQETLAKNFDERKLRINLQALEEGKRSVHPVPAG